MNNKERGKKAGAIASDKPSSQIRKTADEWRLSHEKNNTDYTATVLALTDKVNKLFREHWPERTVYPDESACRSVAILLKTVAENKRKAKPPSYDLGEAGRYAGLFLAHAPAALDRIATKLDWMEEAGESLPFVFHDERDGLARLRSALKQAQDAVTTLTTIEKPTTTFKQVDKFRFIAAAARTAWETTGEEVSLAVSYAEAPLCQFVSKILGEIGRGQPPATVSNHLRDDKQLNPVKSSHKKSPET